MFDPSVMFQLQNIWSEFKNRHPKFPMFMKAVAQTPMEAGTVIELKVTSAQGKEMCSNIKLSEEDIQAFKDMVNITKQLK